MMNAFDRLIWSLVCITANIVMAVLLAALWIGVPVAFLYWAATSAEVYFNAVP